MFINTLNNNVRNIIVICDNIFVREEIHVIRKYLSAAEVYH